MLRKTPLTLTLGVQLNYELISLTKKKQAGEKPE